MVKRNACLVGLAVAAMLVGVFFLFTWLKTASATNNQKYPSRTNCEGIVDLYTDANGEVDMTKFEAMASYDKQNTLDKIGGGYYQCFCKEFSSTEDAADSSKLCSTYQSD